MKMIRLSIFFILSTISLFAHPNTMLDYHLFFKFDKFNITDIGESWSFDEMTSEQLIWEYNLNKEKSLTKKQSIEVGKKIMEGLSQAHYFTYITVDGKKLDKISASGFKAQIKNGIFTLAFNNHLPNSVNTLKSELKVQIKDPDFSVITNLAKKSPILLIGIKKDYCKIGIHNVRQRNVMIQRMYGISSFIPQKEISLSCKEKI